MVGFLSYQKMVSALCRIARQSGADAIHPIRTLPVRDPRREGRLSPIRIEHHESALGWLLSSDDFARDTDLMS